MKLILNFFYCLGILVGGGMFLYALCNYSAINFFKLEKIFTTRFDIIDTAENGITINYNYTVDNKYYDNKLTVSKKYYQKHFTFSPNRLTIIYNKHFPQFSYIKGAKLENRKHKVGMVVSIIFLLFINIVYWFGNRKKWIAIYSGKYGEYKKIQKATI